MDDRGELSGSRIAFLYPDLSTCLVGEFSAGTLVKANPAKVASLALRNGILVPEFDLLSPDEFSRWPSSKHDILCPPQLRDPYEAQLIDVRVSDISGGGEGAFAARDIDEGVVVAYYNGIRMSHNEPSPWDDTGYAIWVEIKQYVLSTVCA